MTQVYQDRTSVFWLANDVDCTATSAWNSGKGFDPIKNFEGTFDGRGHTITNFHINRPDEDNVGLFDRIQNTARVYNVTIDSNSTIVGHDNVGTIAGYFQYAKISGALSQVAVSGHDNVGGIAGASYGYNEMKLEKSAFTGSATSQGYVGGMLGIAYNGYTLQNDYSSGTLVGVIAGGMIGFSVQSCGYHYIDTSIALGTVNGSSLSGGLVGNYTQNTCYDTKISHSIANALQPGAGVNGGIAGSLDSTTIDLVDTYFNNTNGVTSCVGQSSSSTIGTNECTGAGQRTIPTDAPYTSWDFTNVWQVDGSLPTLRIPFSSPTGPTAPQNLGVSQQGDRNHAIISWDAPSDGGTGGVVNYRVQAKKASSGWDSTILNETTTDTTYNFYDLTLGTDYDVRVQAMSDYSAGDWATFEYTSQAPTVFTITTCQQLQDLNNNADAWLDKIVLANDIDCDGIDFMPLGMNSSWSNSSFYGSLDGQGHSIKNLTIDQAGWDVGLFYEAFYGTFENLSFVGGSVHGNGSVGSLAGYAEDVHISNVSSDLQVTSENNDAGGLVGDLEFYRDNTLDNLVFTGDVTSSYSTGGLFGYLDVYSPGVSVSLTKSYSSGTVETPANDYAGGLIGSVYVESEDDDNTPDATFTLQNSYSSADVFANYAAGGLIGSAESYNDGYDNSIASITLDKVYSSGGVSADGDKAGGLIGEVNNLSDAGENLAITNSFAVGSVSASNLAYGLVGGENFAEGNGTYTVDQNYYDLSGTGQIQRDYRDGIENGFGVNDANSQPDYFKNNSSSHPFSNNGTPVWDFEDIWQTNVDGYPTLQASSHSTSADITSAEDGSPIVVAQEGCSTIQAATSVKESSLQVQDNAYSYPLGLVDYELSGCDGGTATVSMYFADTFNPSSAVARKYNATTHAFTTLTDATLTRVTVSDGTLIKLTYTITDGGPLDQDGEVNGTIIDPVGVGLNAVAAPNTGLGLR